MAKLVIHLKELMEKHDNVTQKELSKATGIAQSTISRWVNQYVDRLDKNAIEAFCKYFDCKLTDLISLED